MTNTKEKIIEMENVGVLLGGHWVHKDLNLTVNRGEILAIVGGSGAGKSTLLREILLLQPIATGKIKVFGKDLATLSSKETISIQKRWGVLFQEGALFTSLTLLENVAFPLHEHTDLDDATIEQLALLKIIAAGLPIDSAIKYPSELSGGMQKRAALARATVMEPELLLLDEPTAGLDPQGAAALDELVLNLRETLGLTIVMVTHDLDSLWRVTDRVAFLGEGRVLEVAPMAELVKSKQPSIHDYFSGPRGRAIEKIYEGIS